MNAKRELSSIDLAALVTEMGRYEGGEVNTRELPLGIHTSPS